MIDLLEISRRWWTWNRRSGRSSSSCWSQGRYLVLPFRQGSICSTHSRRRTSLLHQCKRSSIAGMHHCQGVGWSPRRLNRFRHGRRGSIWMKHSPPQRCHMKVVWWSSLRNGLREGCGWSWAHRAQSRLFRRGTSCWPSLKLQLLFLWELAYLTFIIKRYTTQAYNIFTNSKNTKSFAHSLPFDALQL